MTYYILVCLCQSVRVCFGIHYIKYLEVYELANIKSAKKRILVTETKAARNKAIKSGVKTAIKKVEAAVAAMIRLLLRLH